MRTTSWLTRKKAEKQHPDTALPSKARVYVMYHGAMGVRCSPARGHINYFLNELGLPLLREGQSDVEPELLVRIHKYLPTYYKDVFGEDING